MLYEDPMKQVRDNRVVVKAPHQRTQCCPEVEVFSAEGSRLAKILSRDWITKDNWFPPELGAIMQHQWIAPLELDVEAISRGSGGGETGADMAVRHSLRDLMLDPSPPAELLRSTKDFAEAQLRVVDGPLPADVARVLYYASLLVARGRCGEPIGDLSNAELLAGVDWVMSQDWVSSEIKERFRVYRGRVAALEDR